MRRPRWWPRSLWPGSGDEGADPALRHLPDPSGRTVRESPEETFLRTLLAAFSAGRVALVRLDRREGRWRVDQEVREEGWRSLQGEDIPARGHPLTWCLREDLLVQVASEEVLGAGREGGWSMAGPVPGSDRALLISFGGSPPAGARRGLQASLRHVAALEPGAGDSGAPEPFDRSGGSH